MQPFPGDGFGINFSTPIYGVGFQVQPVVGIPLAGFGAATGFVGPFTVYDGTVNPFVPNVSGIGTTAEDNSAPFFGFVFPGGIQGFSISFITDIPCCGGMVPFFSGAVAINEMSVRTIPFPEPASIALLGTAVLIMLAMVGLFRRSERRGI